MASLITANRVRETSTIEGTGNATLLGAVTGFRTFASVMANNDTCLYCIAGGTEWEIGIGTFVSATPALSRTTVLSSTNSNNAVSFSAGTKDVFITDTSERLDLPQLSADPTGPSSGLFLYTRNISGRNLPHWIGATGLSSSVQPSMWGNSVVMWLPGSSTTVGINFGITWTVSATQAHPTIADTSVMTKINRATYTTTTTAGNQSGVRSTAPTCTRNKGFFFAARGGILTYSATMQFFFGLNGASAAMSGDASGVNDSCGFCKDTGKTVWQYGCKDTSVSNYTDTGETTAAGGASNVYEMFVFCKQADSKLTFRLVDIADAAVIVDNVEKSSNLPTAATVLYPHAECRNVAGGAGSGVAIFLSKIYIESEL
jgi:hypothetical protein